MKRGSRPEIRNAFVWTFSAGGWFAFGLVDRSPVAFAVALGFAVIGPIAWFVGRP